MRANSSGSRLAPPTRAPSMSGWAISSAMFDGFTDPPYCTRTRRGRRRRRQAGHDGTDGAAHRLGVVGGGGATGADGPDRLVGDDQAADLLVGDAGETGARPGRCTLASVLPASRSSSVSPTHRIGVMPCGQDGLDLLVDHLVGLAEQLAALGVAGDDVGRRSAWRASAGDTSPVKAPLSSQWQCWAPRAIGMSSASITVCTDRRSVNGGWTDDVDARRSRPRRGR